jgi:release factor glutamine methyltransferase
VALAAAGIENPWHEARLLLAHVTGVSDAIMIGYPERPVDAVDAFLALIARRAEHEPVSHLLGRREFWSLEFEVSSDTLDPRPDSETIVEAALDYIRDTAEPLLILDLGTGTGCLLAALLSELPMAWGVGVDRSAATAAIARRNLQKLGLAMRGQIVVGDWAAPLVGMFDLIVANPPYIPSGEIASLQPEVAKFDPVLALDGGADGLDPYRRLFPELPRILAPDGIALIEFGDGQREALIGLAAANGLAVGDVRADLAGRPRCLICGSRHSIDRTNSGRRKASDSAC